MFNTWFTKAIKLPRGKLLSCPAPPLQWIVHNGDSSIRIWDAESFAAFGKPIVGHTDWAQAVADSSNGQHITSGSYDGTIRIWDVESGMVPQLASP